jgi:hypothetical protein
LLGRRCLCDDPTCPTFLFRRINSYAGDTGYV